MTIRTVLRCGNEYAAKMKLVGNTKTSDWTDDFLVALMTATLHSHTEKSAVIPNKKK